MNVVYAVTENFQDKILPSVRSLADNNEDVDLYIVTETDTVPGLPCEATVINVKDQTTFPESGVNYHCKFTYINLVKACYPDLLDCDKVLHLDADTIVAGNISAFYNINLTGQWIAACPETQHYRRPFGDMYYNMGVALLNLEQLRKDNIVPDLITYMNEVWGPWADQDAWNYYGIEQNKMIPVSNRYNSCFSCDISTDPLIIHYCAIDDWWTNRRMAQYQYLDKYR